MGVNCPFMDHSLVGVSKPMVKIATFNVFLCIPGSDSIRFGSKSLLGPVYIFFYDGEMHYLECLLWSVGKSGLLRWPSWVQTWRKIFHAAQVPVLLLQSQKQRSKLRNLLRELQNDHRQIFSSRWVDTSRSMYMFPILLPYSVSHKNGKKLISLLQSDTH